MLADVRAMTRRPRLASLEPRRGENGSGRGGAVEEAVSTRAPSRVPLVPWTGLALGSFS